MTSSDLKELNQLAMLAELARPLAHECNNFLNNLLLQIAISEKSFPETSRPDWSNLRREGKKLANLFQQWQRHRKQPTEGPTRIDLNQLIPQAAKELRLELGAIEFLVSSSDAPIWVRGFRGDVERLISLLLRYAIAALQNSGAEKPALEIQVGVRRDRIFLRLLNAKAEEAKLQWSDFNDVASSDRIALSLPALTCKALIERLDGSVRIERDAKESLALAVDLPVADA